MQAAKSGSQPDTSLADYGLQLIHSHRLALERQPFLDDVVAKLSQHASSAASQAGRRGEAAHPALKYVLQAGTLDAQRRMLRM